MNTESQEYKDAADEFCTQMTQFTANLIDAVIVITGVNFGLREIRSTGKKFPLPDVSKEEIIERIGNYWKKNGVPPSAVQMARDAERFTLEACMDVKRKAHE